MTEAAHKAGGSGSSQLAIPLGCAAPCPAAVWQAEASVQSAVQALTPQMTENKKRVSAGVGMGGGWGVGAPR